MDVSVTSIIRKILKHKDEIDNIKYYETSQHNKLNKSCFFNKQNKRNWYRNT